MVFTYSEYLHWFNSSIVCHFFLRPFFLAISEILKDAFRKYFSTIIGVFSHATSLKLQKAIIKASFWPRFQFLMHDMQIYCKMQMRKALEICK